MVDEIQCVVSGVTGDDASLKNGTFIMQKIVPSSDCLEWLQVSGSFANFLNPSCFYCIDGNFSVNETLTRFWTLAIAAHVRASGATSRWEAARVALDRFGDDRDLPQRAYSFDVVRYPRARAAWVPPDREVEGLPAVA